MQRAHNFSHWFSLRIYKGLNLTFLVLRLSLPLLDFLASHEVQALLTRCDLALHTVTVDLRRLPRVSPRTVAPVQTLLLSNSTQIQ